MNGLYGLNDQQELNKVINGLKNVCKLCDKRDFMYKFSDIRNSLNNNYKIDDYSEPSKNVQFIADSIEKSVTELEKIIIEMSR